MRRLGGQYASIRISRAHECAFICLARIRRYVLWETRAPSRPWRLTRLPLPAFGVLFAFAPPCRSHAPVSNLLRVPIWLPMPILASGVIYHRRPSYADVTISVCRRLRRPPSSSPPRVRPRPTSRSARSSYCSSGRGWRFGVLGAWTTRASNAGRAVYERCVAAPSAARVDSTASRTRSADVAASRTRSEDEPCSHADRGKGACACRARRQRSKAVLWCSRVELCHHEHALVLARTSRPRRLCAAGLR